MSCWSEPLLLNFACCSPACHFFSFFVFTNLLTGKCNLALRGRGALVFWSNPLTQTNPENKVSPIDKVKLTEFFKYTRLGFKQIPSMTGIMSFKCQYYINYWKQHLIPLQKQNWIPSVESPDRNNEFLLASLLLYNLVGLSMH
jgi:hypothetical protein